MSEIAGLAFKNQKLEKDFKILKNNYDTLVEECQGAYTTIDSLHNKLAGKNVDVKTEPNYLLEKNHLEFEIKQLEQRSVDDESIIVNQKVEIQNIEQSTKKQKEISEKLKKELSETRARFKKERSSILKQHKSEIRKVL